MALILCPHCQQKVSDTSDVCIHCGLSLKDVQRSAETHEPTPAEMQAYEREFDETYSAYRINEEDQNELIGIELAYIFAILGFVFMVAVSQILNLCLHVEISERGMIFWEIGMILLFVSFKLGIIGRIVLTFKMKKYRKRVLFRQKVFQRWLYEKKGVKEFAALDKTAKEWEKKYFSALDVSNEKL